MVKVKVMYYILVYDVASPKRLPKVLKICRRYMHWIQRSVFEGELTSKQFFDLEDELKKVINKKEDSIIFFAIRNREVIKKETIGKELNPITNFF
jgi:CRISPR-associated protein Cas2